MKVVDLFPHQPNELILWEPEKEYVYENQERIAELHNIIKNKTAKRVGRIKTVANIGYGTKGYGLAIGPDGSIILYHPKSDIRNKSPLHWLWWKVNKLYDPASSVEYLTEPDEKVAEIIKTIRIEAK